MKLLWKQEICTWKTYSHFSHGARVITVSGNDDVDIFYNTLESLVQVFRFQLQLKQSTVHLVHEHDGLNTLSNSLTQHSFSLHTDTCKQMTQG